MNAAAAPDASINRAVDLPRRESRLLRAFAETSGSNLTHVRQLAREVLGAVPKGVSFRSRLNNDGSPLQLCISTSPRGTRWRLLGDAHSEIADNERRFARARAVMLEALRSHATAGFASLVERVLAEALPRELGREPAFAAGVLWIGCSHFEPGVAVYVNARWGDAAGRWSRVASCLQALTGRALCPELARAAERHTSIAAIGVEGADAERARIKVYFRLTRPLHLTAVGLSRDLCDPAREFLAVVLEDQAVARTGLVFGIGVDSSTGALQDIKIDVCGHCLGWSQARFQRVVRQLGETFAINLEDIASVGIGELTDLAFLGCGLEPNASARINVYLKGRE